MDTITKGLSVNSNNRISINNAVSVDIPDICNLEKNCFSCPMNEKMLEAYLTREGTVFLTARAESGAFLGYAGMISVLDEAEVLNIAVVPEKRQCGVGLQLMEGLISACRDKSVCSLSLEVRESNSPAIALYNRLGFKEAGIRKNYYEKPRENAIILQKML